MHVLGVYSYIREGGREGGRERERERGRGRGRERRGGKRCLCVCVCVCGTDSVCLYASAVVRAYDQECIYNCIYLCVYLL
jgi:hypothetical protein